MFMPNKMRRFFLEKKHLRSTSMLFLSGSVIVLENPNCKIYDGLTWYKSVVLEVYDGTTLTKMLCWIRWLIQMMFLVDDGFRLTSRFKHEFFPILGYWWSIYFLKNRYFSLLILYLYFIVLYYYVFLFFLFEGNNFFNLFFLFKITRFLFNFSI